jgi:hypothetical protein
MRIRLQDEVGNEIETVYVPWTLDVLEAAARTHTACLRFIDPFGDTYFNKRQARVFLEEMMIFDFQVKREVADAVAHLAQRCADGTHLYLRFIGS